MKSSVRRVVPLESRCERGASCLGYMQEHQAVIVPRAVTLLTPTVGVQSHPETYTRSALPPGTDVRPCIDLEGERLEMGNWEAPSQIAAPGVVGDREHHAARGRCPIPAHEGSADPTPRSTACSGRSSLLAIKVRGCLSMMRVIS